MGMSSSLSKPVFLTYDCYHIHTHKKILSQTESMIFQLFLLYTISNLFLSTTFFHAAFKYVQVYLSRNELRKNPSGTMNSLRSIFPWVMSLTAPPTHKWNQHIKSCFNHLNFSNNHKKKITQQNYFAVNCIVYFMIVTTFLFLIWKCWLLSLLEISFSFSFHYLVLFMIAFLFTCTT